MKVALYAVCFKYPESEWKVYADYGGYYVNELYGECLCLLDEAKRLSPSAVFRIMSLTGEVNENL